MAPKRRAEGAWCVFLRKTRKEWKKWKRHGRDIVEKSKSEKNGKKIEKGERNADAEGKTCRRRCK